MPKFRFKGLNQEFMTSRNFEGIDIPIYVRQDGEERFSPIESCDGNCLGCYPFREAKCGIENLGKAGAWKLRDYKRWNKVVEGEERTWHEKIERFIKGENNSTKKEE